MNELKNMIIKLSNIQSDNINQSTELIARDIIIETIGDNNLETLVPIGLPNFTQTIEPSIYKRDYILMTFQTNDTCSTKCKSKNSDIINYNVYAIENNNTTYVVTMIEKSNLDKPLIYYYETIGDSASSIIDLIFEYQTDKQRTLSMKRNKYVVTNSNKYLNDVDLTLYPTIDEQLPDIDSNMTKLMIILKNKQYISTTDESVLLAFSDLLFYF